MGLFCIWQYLSKQWHFKLESLRAVFLVGHFVWASKRYPIIWIFSVKNFLPFLSEMNYQICLILLQEMGVFPLFNEKCNNSRFFNVFQNYAVC